MKRRPCMLSILFLLIQSFPLFAQPLTLVNAFPRLTFTQPVFLTHPTDGSNRIFVVQQNGLIKVFPNDSTIAAATTFLDLSRKLSASSGEEGLLGLAFSPQFSSNRYFYVNYTAPSPLRTVVARYSVSPTDPSKADTASEFKIIEIGQPFTNHNGGMLAFGPDGYLYIGMGDGGSANDPNGNGQNRSALLGKILRIDVNDTTASHHYVFPPDNPFAGNAQGFKEEIWAYGMRNPWRFSFDPADGQLWAGDVGQGTREEVDIIRRGGNYGWNIMEGKICRPPATSCDTTGLILPIKDYDHSLGISITGGYVYHGYRRPGLRGAYVYGDYGSGRIWMLRYANGSVTADSLLLTIPNLISSFGTDKDNELYVVTYVSGGASSIYRFAGNPFTDVVASPRQGLPAGITLEQNYPNPFNPTTSIGYTIAGVSGEHLPPTVLVRLGVFDILGRRVATLVDAPQLPGNYVVQFDARGSASGVYVYRLMAGGYTEQRKMIVLR